MLQILVIGESCFDRFVYCDTNRLSPEAPVPVLIPRETKINLGMAGNVVNNISSINFMAEPTQWVQKEQIVKTRYIDKKSNHMFFRVDEGEEMVTPLQLDENKRIQITRYDIVIVSDYDKGFLTLETIEEIGRISKLSILDSKKTLSTDVLNAFTFVKLNDI